MPDLTVAVAQPAGASQELGENVSAHVRMASLAAEHGAQLVLFPELSLTGYHWDLTLGDAVDAVDTRLLPLQAFADAHDVVVVAGAPIASPQGLHIGTMSFMPQAGVTTYLKRHLGAGEEVAFVPGLGGGPLVLADQVVAFAICADITHPEHASGAARGGATIYAASCLLAEGVYEADAELLRRYAREHQMVVMMANYGPPVSGWSPAGRSAIWSSDGSLLGCAPPGGEALVVAAKSSGGWNGTVVT
jgi:predicted amidohydrolase